MKNSVLQCVHVLNGQLMLLSAYLTNEIMTSFKIKQDDNGVPV
jgi:hypothetical protein